MERIIDFLAEEEARTLKAAKKARKAGKKERVKKLLKTLAPSQPVVVDYLAMGD